MPFPPLTVQILTHLKNLGIQAYNFVDKVNKYTYMLGIEKKIVHIYISYIFNPTGILSRHTSCPPSTSTYTNYIFIQAIHVIKQYHSLTYI
jgi:hypothetical protein